MDAVPSKFRMTTLGENGYKLPIGKITPDSHLLKDFTLRPYRMKEERALAEYKAKYRGALTLGSYVSQMLATMVESIGGRDFQALPEHERRLSITSMFMADVMYMYVMLRRDALGETLGMHIPCSACRQRFDFQADLNTLDIAVMDDAALLYWQHKLKHPLTHSGAARGIFKMQPALWSSLESKTASDAAGMRAAVICGSVCGMEGIPDNEFAPLSDHFLDEMTKLDLERISYSIEINSPGPKMGVEEVCPTCHITMFWPIDWGSDSFFSHSSLHLT